MKVRVELGDLRSHKTDAIIVGVFESCQLDGELLAVDKLLNGAISSAIEAKEFLGSYKQFRLISTLGKLPAKNILLMGLGKKEDFTLETLRRVSAMAVRFLRDFFGITRASTILHEAEVPGTSKTQRVQAVVEGAVLGQYQYVEYKTVDKEKIKKFEGLVVLSLSNDQEELDGLNQSVRKAVVLAGCENFVRDIVNSPASECTPAKLASIAKSLKSSKIKVTVYDKDALEKMGMNGILSIGKGSVNHPNLILIQYRGGGKESIALVGKGICFDSGGLNLKTPEGMASMKSDMAGAAVILGVVRAAAELGLKTNIIGLLACAENMPGSNACKPGDIIKTYGGKTIEVINTDAEGRVVLADALGFAEKFKPDSIISIATLTGACVVALGGRVAGVLGTDQKLVSRLISAGESSGELVWQLPLFKDYFEEIKSDVADVRNLAIHAKEAGTITAAAFLASFVNNTPFAHLDIAGPAWEDENVEHTVRGGTGFGVRLLITALEQSEEKDKSKGV